MVMHKDYKAYVTLGLLVVGLVFSILALSTNYWSTMNMDTGEGKLKLNMGLWKSCLSQEVLSISSSPCFDSGNEASDSATLGDMNGKRSDQWSSDDEYSYNDVKIARWLEFSALLGSIATIVAWVTYLILRAKEGPKMHGTQAAMKILAIVCTMATATAHLFGVIFWVIENEVQLNGDGFSSRRVKWSYGWSFAIAVSASGVHVLTVVPMVLTKHKKLNDGMEHSMIST